MKRTALIVAFVMLLGHAKPASAFIVTVIDPANLIQSIMIAARTFREYQQLVEQYQLLYKMAKGLPGMIDYRIRHVVNSGHQAARFPYGGQLLNAMNNGDPRGETYSSAVLPLGALPDRLPEGVSRTLMAPFAAVEIADSVAQRAIHQGAMIRGSFTDTAYAIDALERDVMNSSESYHSMTANLDKIAGAELIGRHQDSASNQLLSHVVEQQLVKTKRMRDAEAASMNMRVNAVMLGAAAQSAVFAGSAGALGSWRQP